MSVEDKLQQQSHSGAVIKVRKKDYGKTLVEKIIHSDIERNYLAVKKQEEFKTYSTSNYLIKAIPVINAEKGVNLRVEMPYIEGLGGDLFSVHGNKHIAKELKETLNSYLIDSLARAKVETINNEIILSKLTSIANAPIAAAISEVTILGIKYAEKLSESGISMPIISCHGDLTLSNMIIKNSTLYLFDFLDSFIESPLQDAAKIIQDMKYGWTFRKQSGSIKLKGQLFCEAAYPSFIETLKEIYPVAMRVLEILTILRIAPYVNEHDHLTLDWYNKTMKYILGEAIV